MTVLGIDVGAGAVKSAVFAEGAAPVAAGEQETARSYAALVDQLRGIVSAARRDHGVAAAGVGVPGFLSRPAGVVERSPNMRFLGGAPLEDGRAGAMRLPVRVVSDASAGAVGEGVTLEGGRPEPVVRLTLGSGID